MNKKIVLAIFALVSPIWATTYAPDMVSVPTKYSTNVTTVIVNAAINPHKRIPQPFNVKKNVIAPSSEAHGYIN